MDSKANPNASSSPQASSNPLLQNSESMGSRLWLAPQEDTCEHEEFCMGLIIRIMVLHLLYRMLGKGAKIRHGPTAKQADHRPSRTYVGKGKGLETEKKGRKAETNGKAEADEISFTPRHQVQLMLAGRLYVGASIDNTSPYSFFSPHEACLITPQRIKSRDRQVWTVA